MTDIAERILSYSVLAEKKGEVPTTNEKWWAAAILGLLFWFLASPISFSITNPILQALCLPGTCEGGKPTFIGLLLHAVVFTLVVRWMML